MEERELPDLPLPLSPILPLFFAYLLTSRTDVLGARKFKATHAGCEALHEVAAAFTAASGDAQAEACGYFRNSSTTGMTTGGCAVGSSMVTVPALPLIVVFCAC